ncbi:cytochrome b5, partial [Neoconidiobolus thromboides FSU 785]
LPEPKNDIFTPEELKKYDGSDESLPVYLAIKGKVFDVSDAREAYGPGGNYNCFAGIDGSRGLATSSLKKADMSHDYSDLGPDKLKVLDHWYNFYLGKYPIVGVVKRD